MLSGDREAIAQASLQDLEKIVAATHRGMTVEAFDAIARTGSPRRRTPCKRPYTELVYQPMLEVMR